MKFKRPNQDSLELNLTPLIDCLLFLIIFFMLSTTFSKTGKLQVTLPDAEATMPAGKDKPVEIAIDAAGQIAVNGNVLASPDRDKLNAALSALAGDKDKQPLIISADGKAPHASVVLVMDVAGQLGFRQIGIGTQTTLDKPAP